MKTTMILALIKQAYQAVLRDLLLDAVKRTDNDLDDKVVEFLDLLLG